MSVLRNRLSVLPADGPAVVGHLMGISSILLSLWIYLNIATEKTWITGAVFPVATLAVASGLAARRRMVAHFVLCVIALVPIFGTVTLAYPNDFSFALLAAAAGFFVGVLFVFGYIWPEIRQQWTGAG